MGVIAVSQNLFTARYLVILFCNNYQRGFGSVVVFSFSISGLASRLPAFLGCWFPFLLCSLALPISQEVFFP